MKTALLFIFFIVSQASFCQIGKVPATRTTETTHSNTPNYTYKLNLFKISNVSYPGTKIQLKLMQIAAVLDKETLLYPEVKSDYGAIYKICPFVLFGYKKDSFNTDPNCKTTTKNALTFSNDAVPGHITLIKIPKERVSMETKLIIGTYGAEVVLPNGTSKKLRKANLKTVRLAELDFSVRNYIKHEINVDGALITLEYILERGSI